MIKSSLVRINLIFILIFILFIPNLVSAETKTFIKEYTYQASEYDSKVTCRVLALEQVKRLLLEEVGTYLESQTEVKNFQLSKDQITVLTAGVVKAEILKEAWDGKAYWFRAKIGVDIETAIKALDKLRKDREKTRELEEAKRKIEGALNEVENLKKELQTVKGDQEKKKKYDDAVNVLSAKEWFDNGEQLLNSSKYLEGYKAFTKAIEIDPRYALAYTLRGLCCLSMSEEDENEVKRSEKKLADPYIKKDIKKCFIDLNTAINLESNNARAYKMRGAAYIGALGNSEQAISDFTSCIELESSPNATNTELCYYNRARVYEGLGQYNESVADYNKAIEIDPIFVKALAGRGTLYGDKLKDYEKAIKDYDVLIRITPEIAMYHAERGFFQSKIKKYKEALDDLNHAIILDSKNAGFQYLLGGVYEDLRDHDKAKNHYSKSIALNPKWAEAYNARGRLFYDDAALADLNKAIALEPYNAEFYNSRGNLYYDRCYRYVKSVSSTKKGIKPDVLKSKWCKAMADDFHKAIQIAPNDSEAYEGFWNANTFIFKNYRAACYNTNKICELNPNFFTDECIWIKDIGYDFCEEKWGVIGKDTTGNRWYYKKAGLSSKMNGTIKLWLWIFHPTVEKTSAINIVQSKRFVEVNCAKKMTSIVKDISYMHDGTSSTLDFEDKFDQVYPGTLFELLIEAICKN